MKCNSIVDRNLMDMNVKPFRQDTDMTKDVRAIGNTVLCNAAQFLYLYSLKQDAQPSPTKQKKPINTAFKRII